MGMFWGQGGGGIAAGKADAKVSLEEEWGFRKNTPTTFKKTVKLRHKKFLWSEDHQTAALRKDPTTTTDKELKRSQDVVTALGHRH